MNASRQRTTAYLEAKALLDAVADPTSSQHIAGALHAQASAVLTTMTKRSNEHDTFCWGGSTRDRALPSCGELLKPLELLLTCAETLERLAAGTRREAKTSDSLSSSVDRARNAMKR